MVSSRSPTSARSDACMRVSVTDPYQRRTTTDSPRSTAMRISAPTAHHSVEAATPPSNPGSMTSSVMRPSRKVTPTTSTAQETPPMSESANGTGCIRTNRAMSAAPSRVVDRPAGPSPDPFSGSPPAPIDGVSSSGAASEGCATAVTGCSTRPAHDPFHPSHPVL